jgi:16S rRNA (cytosine967-C5)-methyltransferase
MRHPALYIKSMPEPQSSAREVAFAVIRRVFEEGAYADRALHSEARALAPRERALATALSYGTVQRRATLDYAIERLSERPVARLQRALLAALRLGLYQLLYLDGVPEHAAVSESVQLAKRAGRPAASLANAVLRRAARERAQLLGSLSDRAPAEAALMHSVPQWLAELWFAELGPGRARSLLAAVNRSAEASLRVNTLRAAPAEVLAELPVAARPAGPELPEGLVVQEPFDAHGSELFTRGAIMPQARGSMLVARVLDPRPGERALDLCAAPGAKTTHLAALMGGRSELVAVERHPGRAAALQRSCARMGAQTVRVLTADALRAPLQGGFDRVLLDPPCSGLGTLQSRPDLRWRTSAARVRELSELQRRLIERAAELTAPGGTLVYSVCTISAAEGEGALRELLAARPDFEAIDLQARHPRWSSERGALHLQLLPDRDGTDGFFIAALRRLK